MKSIVNWATLLSLVLLGADPAHTLAHEEESESLSGEISLLISTDFEKNTVEKVYHFRDGKTDKITELNFKGEKVPEEILNLKPGTKVKIKGKKGEDHVEYDSLESTFKTVIVNHEGTHEEYPSSAFTGAKKVLAVRVNFLDANSSCQSESIIYDKILNPALAQSNKNFFEKSSHGLMSLTGETATVKVNLKLADQTSCDYRGYESSARAALIAAGYNLSNYTHHMYILPTISKCPGGQGWIGSPPTTWLYYCSDKIMAHELGHNFGLHHAGDFTNEYNDYSDTMGRAYREFNAPHKHQLGWIPTNKVVTITGPGTYRISPLNAAPANAAHPQIYRVYDSTQNYYYYLSFRDKSGDFDANLSSTYADRINIHRYRGTGSDITRFITAIGDGGSDTIPNTSFTVKNNARTSSYIEMIVTGGGGSGDTTAPSVSISSPSNGSSFNAGSSVTASASASDNVGVTKVEFYLNNSLKCTDTSSHRSCSFSMPTGSNLPLKAKAYDAAGNSKESSIVYISSNSVDTTAPSVSLTSPSNGSRFNAGSTVSASASASDNVGVTKVEFYLNNSLKCTDSTSPYSCSFAMPTGSNLPLKAKAYDAAGNSKDSSIISISSNSVDSTAPSVSLTSPANGSSFDENSSVTALASASDNVGVTKVEFYLNNSLKCTDSSSPYSCSFSMPSGSNLPLKAKAYDAAGNSKESAIISISSKSSSVDTEKPVIKITSPASGSEHDADSEVTINFQASDNVGITRLYCYGVDGWRAFSSSASSCKVKLPSTAGDYTVRVYASDAARNYVYADLPLKIKAATTVDTEKPVIKITSPASGSEHDADSMVTLNFQASDNVGIVRQYCYGASGWVSIGANASSCQVKMPASGDLAAKVYAVDASSNYSIEEIALKVKTEVTVDTEKPVITITSPADGSEHEASSVVTINFEATDNVGIKSLYCYTPTGWKSVPLVKPYKCDVQMPASGNFRTRVWAYDTSMNANDRYLLLKMKEEVTVDTEKPVINITSPAAGSKHPADSMVTINFTATDNVGVERIYCYGASGWEMQSSTARSCQVRMPASGDFSARVYASDAANNYAIEYLSLSVGSSTEVDTEKPVVKILSPRDGSHHGVGSLVTIEFEATDNVEIQSLYCYSSDGWRHVSLTKPYSCQIKMPASGNFRTRVWAYDTSKNYDYQWLNLYGE